MSLGVLNNLSAVYAENNLNNTNNSLSKTLQQLSSGSKINSGADDAAGLSLVDGLEANQTALTQSVTNASEGVGLLQVADGALSQVTTLLNRAVTLATEAANGTLNSSQDTAANQEYQSILSEISNIGSTTTYNNQAVFNSNTNIYTGDSSTAGSAIDALNIRALSSSNMGDTGGVMAYNNGASNVFINLSNSSTGKNASVSDTLGAATASTTLTVAYMTKGANGSAVQASAPITVGAGTNYANTVQGMIAAINGAGLGLTASFGTAAQAGTAAVAAANAAANNTTNSNGGIDTGIIITGAGIGANGAGLADDGVGEVGTLSIHDTSSAAADADTFTAGTLSIVGSDGKTHNITLGVASSTDTLANLAATINSAGYGVTATYNATDANYANAADIVFTTADPHVTVSATSLASSAGTTALSGVPTAAGTQQMTEVGTLAGAVTTAGTLTIGTSAIALGISTLAQQQAAINNGHYGVTATMNQAGNLLTLWSANSSVVETADTATGSTYTAVAAPVVATTNQYYSVGISGTVADSSTSGGTANVGIMTDTNGTGGIATVSYSDNAGMSLSTTDLTSQSNAQSALTALNMAITDVAAQDGYIGAQINTLNAVSQVISTQQENMQAAQNAVQATDYAAASSNMSKYEILSQTGISALAQANSVQQEVTKLLQ